MFVSANNFFNICTEEAFIKPIGMYGHRELHNRCDGNSEQE